jgi:rhamnose utilization protein RhaD (predicted bifunctional aldolase and dehydrogenase)
VDEQTISELLNLSRDLGTSPHEWAILGEGNTSARIDDESFYVKASGSQLATLSVEQLVRVRFGPLVEAIASDVVLSDADVRDLLLASRLESEAPMPSVETLFHADLLNLPGVKFIGHTHIVSINSLICSERGWDLVRAGGRLFPDEIVVCGAKPCCVGYVDPGLTLARAIHEAVVDYRARLDCAPKTIYLQNHGFVALGKSAREVLSITRMADKAARVLLGAIACGAPRFLSDAEVARIATRPDEHLRQRALGLSAS